MPITSRFPNRNGRRGSAAGGFTLIESMVASVVLAFCVVAISAAVTASNVSTTAADESAVALGAARQDMEILASQPLTSLTTPAGGTSQTIDLSDFAATATSSTTADASATFVSRSAQQGANDIAVIKVQTKTPDGRIATLYRVVTKEGNGQ